MKIGYLHFCLKDDRKETFEKHECSYCGKVSEKFFKYKFYCKECDMMWKDYKYYKEGKK